MFPIYALGFLENNALPSFTSKSITLIKKVFFLNVSV